MQIDHQHTLTHALNNGVNLFLGAGFSILATNADEKPFPLAQQLTKDLSVHFNVEGDLPLPQLATIIQSSHRDELRDYLVRVFSTKSFDRRYAVLSAIAVRRLFTTNIDDLLFKIYGDDFLHYLNDLYSRGPSFADRAAIDFVPLHGNVQDSSRPLIFSSLEIASAANNDPDRWHLFRQALREYPTVFWGYGLHDAGVLQMLLRDTGPSQGFKERWAVLPLNKAPQGTAEYFRALGCHLVDADTAAFLDFLKSGVLSGGIAAISAHEPLTPALFPNELIPTQSQVPVRPITEFFLGSPPQWSDIYSGAIARTHHYDTAKNYVLSGKHTMLIGMPATGKTTLLMDLAASVTSSDRAKLVVDSVTPERATNILTKLNGRKATIFLDNFADSIDGAMVLSSSKNVQLVGAERDYGFEIAAHLIDRSKFHIVDITDLTSHDVQLCIDAIPKSILRQLESTDGDAAGGAESLFEIIEDRLDAPTLRLRFGNVLRQLRKESAPLQSLLIMISYVHKCRTPVAMDMLFAYISDITSDHNQMYNWVAKLGAMVKDAAGYLVDNFQDYFAPRSSIIAEAIFSQAPTEAIGEMLMRFHSRVSPLRISHYDVFRRYAFDNSIVDRGFTNIQDGLTFYDQVYSRDRSPYALQHAALFLSKRGKHAEAFKWIDRAVGESGGRIWAIRNSAAIILFRANIEHVDDAHAVTTLHKSMKDLRECYTKDRRKPFHICVFSEHARKLWSRLPDETSREYLELARQWMADEMRRSPWHRKLARENSELHRLLATLGT